MRRKDREVTDWNEILEMISECDIIRIGLADGDYPYIVPMNFACAVRNNETVFYVHGAMAGRKYELMKKNKRCSFEMDIPINIECLYEEGYVTMRYKSIMGKALIEFLDGDEKNRAIKDVFMNRYDETRNFEYDESSVERTAVARLTVKELSAKANLSSN